MTGGVVIEKRKNYSLFFLLHFKNPRHLKMFYVVMFYSKQEKLFSEDDFTRKFFKETNKGETKKMSNL